MNLQVVAEVLAFALFLSMIVERLVEQFVAPITDRTGVSWALPYAALILGVAVSWAFNIDIFTPLAESVSLTPRLPWAGVILTGIVVGGGSSLLHDLWPK